MLVDHLFQYRISPWPKTVEKRGFCTCVMDIRTDGRTDGPTDGRTDRPSYRDAFLTHLKTSTPASCLAYHELIRNTAKTSLGEQSRVRRRFATRPENSQ